MRLNRRLSPTFGLALLALLLLAPACGGDGGGESNKVSVQLDWTPNTNHIGVYIALAKGWYKEAGLDVEVLPYTDVNPDVIVANGRADVGVSFPPNVIFSRAAGLDVVSGAAGLERSGTEPSRPASTPASACPTRSPRSRPLSRRTAARARSRRRRSPLPPTRRCTTAAPTSQRSSSPGRASRRRCAESSCAPSVMTNTACPTSTASSSSPSATP